MDELQHLYDLHQAFGADVMVNVFGHFQHEWTSTQRPPNGAWMMYLEEGLRISVSVDVRLNARALCVRTAR